jgi:hypothetical protein
VVYFFVKVRLPNPNVSLTLYLPKAEISENKIFQSCLIGSFLGKSKIAILVLTRNYIIIRMTS